MRRIAGAVLCICAAFRPAICGSPDLSRALRLVAWRLSTASDLRPRVNQSRRILAVDQIRYLHRNKRRAGGIPDFKRVQLGFAMPRDKPDA